MRDAQAVETPVNRLQNQEAHALSIAAIKNVRRGRWEQAQAAFAQARDPLASKLYHWLLLTHAEKDDWTNELFIRLSYFVRHNPEWPGISTMKLRAEGVMPSDLSNAEVLAWYDDFPPRTPYAMGRYMDALIIEGKAERARAFLADWWAGTLTSRDQQRSIFKKYGGYLTIDAHKKRFDSLLRAGHYDSARGIADVLGQGYPALAEARIALKGGGGKNIDGLVAAVPSYLLDDPGLMYERLRWRRERGFDQGALEILRDAPDHIQNREAWWKERHIFIRRLLEKGDYKGAYDLASDHKQVDGFSYAQAEWLAGWLALQFMHKPTEGYERFVALYHNVNTPVSKARASYWAGRAATGLGQSDLAQSWYKTAAEFKTTFYGQMAGAALSLRGGLPQGKLPSLSSAERKDYKRNELMQAALLFKEAGDEYTANSFINAFLENDETPKAYRYAAEILAGQDDFYRAVQVAKKASHKGLFLTKQAYPTITKHLTGINSAEWALIHALIRQESMFDATAKSSAGALGLMQLMPATAREVSKKENIGYNQDWLTERPKYNMELGASYIGGLLKKYDDSYPIAIAAYNAGPGRVDGWLRVFGDPRKGDINIIDWIELLPVYETRNYVQRVLENTYIYRLRLEGIQAQPIEELHLAFHVKP